MLHSYNGVNHLLQLLEVCDRVRSPANSVASLDTIRCTRQLIGANGRGYNALEAKVTVLKYLRKPAKMH